MELRNFTNAKSVAVNPYPYEIQEHGGYLYVSNIGGNAAATGNARLVKYDPKTNAAVATYDGGVYTAGNGLLGFCIAGNKAYVIHNKWNVAQVGIDIIDLATMTLIQNIPLGAGGGRNCVTDGTAVYIPVEAQNALLKLDIATNQLTTLYTFAPNAKPFRIAYFGGKLWVCLFNNHEIKVLDTSGVLLATIATGAGSQPNWFGQDDSNIYCALYGTHKAVKLNATTYAIDKTYTMPAADYPHIPFPVMGKQLWVGGTTSPTSYIRVFDITTGNLLTSYAKGANIPSMACDGGNVWSVSANGNLIQREILDLVGF